MTEPSRRPGLVERLRWRDPGEAVERGADAAMMARLLTYLYGMAAVLLAATLLIDGDPERNAGVLAAVGAAAALIAVVLIVAYDRTPIWMLQAAPALGATLTCVLIYYGGPTSTAVYSLYLVWVVIAAALFYEPLLILIHGTYAVSAYAVVLGLLDTPSAQLTLQVAMSAGTVVAVAVVMIGVTAQQRLVLARLESAARTDPLTGLLNRRALAQAFDNELARADRSGDGLGLVMLDLDGFKGFNDRNGHPAGDRALIRLGDVLESTTRSIDPIARVGGEEFAVLAPQSDLAGTLALAERLRRAVEVEFSGPDPLTVSCGVAAYPSNGLNASDLSAAADAALYDAKDQGRNQAVASTVEAPPRAGTDAYRASA